VNDIELAKLENLVDRLRRMKAHSKVHYHKYNNVYAWGLADGVELSYDMINALYEQLKNSSMSDKIDS